MNYGRIDIRHADCMDVMKEYPKGYFDIAIVDPPYGIGSDRMNLGEGYSDSKYSSAKYRKSQMQKFAKGRLGACAGKLKNRAIQKLNSSWDVPPPPAYFRELRRVSKHQIICGGNYFKLPPSRCWVAWDKEQPWKNFSQMELIYTSYDFPAKLFRHNNGFGNPGKIHPTQKPVELYKWLLQTFAKRGMRILDTHLGSGSIAIACYYFGCDLVACEIDEDYCTAARARFTAETRQQEMFLPCDTPEQTEFLMDGTHQKKIETEFSEGLRHLRDELTD